jgi:hypothetical protein
VAKKKKKSKDKKPRPEGIAINVCNGNTVGFSLLKELINIHDWNYCEHRERIKGVNTYWLHTLDKSYWEEASALIRDQPMIFNKMPGLELAAGSKRNQAMIFNRLS